MPRIPLLPARLLLGLLLALAVPTVALANSVPTPEIYIRFAGWPAGRPGIVGAQLQGCADEACAAPTLLVSQGRCAGAPCLSGAAAYGEGLYPLPASGRALAFGLRWSSEPSWDDFPRFRVVVALADGSAAAGELAPAGYRSFFTARLADGRIALEPYEQFPESTARTAYVFLSLGAYLLLNLLTEPLGVALVAWRRRLPGPWGLLAASVPINLISFPIVWGVFPAFTPFAGPDDLALAWASLAFVAVAAAAVAGLSALPGVRGASLVAALWGLAPLLCAGLAASSQALAGVPLPGFPSLTTSPLLNLAIIEVTVVLLEGWLYHRVRGAVVGLADGMLLALGGNLASLAAMFAVAAATGASWV